MSAAKVRIHTEDGVALTAYRHDPVRGPHAAVVIAPGMAIRQAFYADFAAWLATEGYRVWTFDYRGMAESAAGPMRQCNADVSRWVVQDYDAVVRHAAAEGLPVFVVGHSLGGQVAPLLPSAKRLAGLANIAVGSGAVRHNQPRQRAGARFLWHVLVPLLCPLFGYFPGKRIGIIGDLPTGAVRQWRRWCLSPDYLLSCEPGAREAYAQAAYPVMAMTFADDELLLPEGSRMMHGAYRATDVEYREVQAAEFGLKRIGHFGFFRAEHEKVLWPVVRDWFAAMLELRGAHALK